MTKKFTFLIMALLALMACPGWGQTTFNPSDYSDQGGASGTGGTATATKNGITIASTKAYVDGTTAVREYKDGTLTVTSSGPITSVVITATGNSYAKFTASNGNISTSNAVQTWTGSSNSIVFTATAQCRWKSIEITASSSTGPSITCANITDVPYEGVADAEDPVTISNADGWTPSVTCDGDVVTDAALNTDNTKVIYSVSENTGNTDRTGSFTITLSKTGETSITKEVSVTQKHFVVDYATLPFEWAGGTSGDLTALNGVKANGLGSDYAEGNAPYRVKFDTNGDYIQVKTDGQPGIVTIGTKMLGGATTSYITIKASSDGENFDDGEKLTISGNSNDVVNLTSTRAFAADVRYVRMVFTKGSNVGVGPITIAKHVQTYTPTVNLNDASFGTISEPVNNVYTITPNPGYKIVDYTTSSTDVTVTPGSVNPFGPSTYTITAFAENQTVTFNLEARTPATITWHHGAGGNTTFTTDTYTDATLGTLPTIAEVNGWTSRGWTTESTFSTMPSTVTAETLVGNITDLYAIYSQGSETFVRIHSTDDLVADGIYMIGSKGTSSYYFINGKMSGTNSDKYMGITTAQTLNDGVLNYTTGEKFVLGGDSENGYTFKDDDNYLYLPSAGGLNLTTSLNNNARWDITFNESGTDYIINKSDNAKYIEYYSQYNEFTTAAQSYANASIFKQSSITTYTSAPSAEKIHVYYNGNGNNSGAVPTDNNEYNINDEVTVLGNTGNLTKEHYYFYCWSDEVDGNSEGANLYDEGDKFNIQANTTLFAQWLANEHTLTLNYTSEDEDAMVSVDYGSTSYLEANGDNAQVGYGTEVEITTAFNSGYICNITVTDASSNVIQLTNNKFNMPDSDVTITISIVENPYKVDVITAADLVATNTTYKDFSGVTKTSYAVYAGNSAKDGNNIQLRSKNSESGIVTTSTGGKVKYVKVNIESGLNGIEIYGNTQPYTSASELYATTGNTNQGILVGTLTATGVIDFDDLETNYYYVGIRSHSGAIYLSSIEISWEETVIDDIVEIDNAQTLTGCIVIGEDGMIDIKDGGSLTIQGNLVCDDSNQILIEDGGQLITSSTGVKATILKDIAAHGTTDGWNFIATPIADGSAVSTVQTGTYDLYRFNQAADKEWENVKNTEHNFTTLANGQGYLYANAANTTLEFAGTLYNGNGEIALTYAATDDQDETPDWQGWNLVGNPFTFKAYPSLPYYAMNTEGTAINAVTSNGQIDPCTSVFVQATPTNQKVTFSKDAPDSRSSSLEISLTQANTRSASRIDNAIVSFGEGQQLEKLYMFGEGSSLYIPQGDKEYAIVSAETEGTLPLCFKTSKNGNYTITVNTENIDAEYIHLIDNMTGMDTDLLSTPSYTFSAKTSDYACRFKLVFSMSDEASANSDSNFAFMSDGNLVISNIEGEATLQIIDMMGRVLSTETVSANYNKALNLRAGVYVLNLNGMTQKIVVE